MQEPTTADVQNEIVEEFLLFDDWEGRYEYLIDLGKKLEQMPAELKTEENRIKGCQSQVWLYPRFSEGKIYLLGDSDALIVKGLVFLLLRIFSGQSPKAILETNLTFIDDIGMTRHLAQTRSNGLLSMIKQIQYYALAYSAKTDS